MICFDALPWDIQDSRIVMVPSQRTGGIFEEVERLTDCGANVGQNDRLLGMVKAFEKIGLNQVYNPVELRLQSSIHRNPVVREPQSGCHCSQRLNRTKQFGTLSQERFQNS